MICRDRQWFFSFQIIFLFSIVKYEPLVYNRIYEYPIWAQVIGNFLALSSMLCIPFYMLYKIIKTPGLAKQVRRKRLTEISEQFNDSFWECFFLTSLIPKMILFSHYSHQRWKVATTSTIPDRPEARKARKLTSYDLRYIDGGKREFM